jgi:hypothetical protein
MKKTTCKTLLENIGSLSPDDVDTMIVDLSKKTLKENIKNKYFDIQTSPMTDQCFTILPETCSQLHMPQKILNAPDTIVTKGSRKMGSILQNGGTMGTFSRNFNPQGWR